MLDAATGSHVPLFIGNENVAGEGAPLTVIDPVTEDVVAEFKGASVAQVDLACRAAERAFEFGGLVRCRLPAGRAPEVRRSAGAAS